MDFVVCGCCSCWISRALSSLASSDIGVVGKDVEGAGGCWLVVDCTVGLNTLGKCCFNRCIFQTSASDVMFWPVYHTCGKPTFVAFFVLLTTSVLMQY